MQGEDAAEESLLASMALSMVKGVGPRVQAELLSHFDTPLNILRQPMDVLQSVEGVGPVVARSIVEGQNLDAARKAVEECRRRNVTLLNRGSAEYPNGLEEVADAPHLMYVRGTLKPEDSLAVAIVGSRRCTAYGRKQAERMAGSLVRAGFTVISGLARGIDAAAHRGALNAGGRTIAVMATGVVRIYPPEHAELAEDIVKSGAVVSEFPLHQEPKPGLFPQRNRIISGLSLGVIVIEATRKSGSLYTARHAMEQGREVFAVPGNIDSLASAGCLDLIRDGVTLIRHVDDVLQELGPLASPVQQSNDHTIRDPREMNLNPQETEVLQLVGTSPVPVDEVVRQTQLGLSRVLSTLTVLEMKRFVSRLPGNMVVRR